MLKVYAFGNQPFMDKYSQGLTEDCEHYGYEKHFSSFKKLIDSISQPLS